MAHVKKIVCPKTFEELKKSAYKAYLNQFEIKNFYTESGSLVTSMKQVRPGCMLLVTSMVDTNLAVKTFGKQPGKTKIPSATIKKSKDERKTTKRKRVRINTTEKHEDEKRDVIRPPKYVNLKTLSENKPENNEDDSSGSYDDDPDFDNEEIQLRNEIEKSEEENEKPSKSSQINEEEPSTEDSDEEIFDNVEKEEELTECEEEEKERIEESETNYVEDEINAEEEEEDQVTTLYDIFKDISGTEVSLEVKKHFNKGSKQTSSFIKQCAFLEELQGGRWFKSGCEMLDSMGISLPDDFIGRDELINIARSNIAEHRQIFPGGVYHTMNTCVTGPKKSGVTTLLGVIAREFFVDLVATKEFKKHFVVVYDVRDFIGSVDPKGLFFSMLQLTLDHIKWHRPDLIPDIPTIKKCLTNVIQARGNQIHISKSANIDLNIAAKLEAFASYLSYIYADENEFASWIRCCVELPINIGRILGFNRFTIIADDIDKSLFESLESATPFKYSAISLNDVICPVLTSNSFIVSCLSYDDLDIQIRCSENTTFKHINVISTVDSIHYEDSSVLNVTFKETKGTFSIDVSACGGIPAFIAEWFKVKRIFDKIDEMIFNDEEDTEEYEEELLQAEDATERLVHILFTPSNEKSSLTVKSVKRA